MANGAKLSGLTLISFGWLCPWTESFRSGCKYTLETPDMPVSWIGLSAYGSWTECLLRAPGFVYSRSCFSHRNIFSINLDFFFYFLIFLNTLFESLDPELFDLFEALDDFDPLEYLEFPDCAELSDYESVWVAWLIISSSSSSRFSLFPCSGVPNSPA